jgi:hypothetical protein
MALPSTRQGLIDYCLRSLGAPVLEINLDEDQIEDRVDEAIQFYQTYHSDALVRTFYKHQLTQEDIDNTYITLPDELIYVNRVFQLKGSSMMGTDLFSVQYQMMMSDIYSLRDPGAIVNYEITKQYMNMIELELNGMSQQIIFSRHQNRISIAVDWKNVMRAGQWVIFEGYIALEPAQYPKIYNDMILKKYTTALLKRQWGQNLSKFEGMQLPGGVTINGSKIFEEANVEIEKIETEFELRFAMPTDFYIG